MGYPLVGSGIASPWISGYQWLVLADAHLSNRVMPSLTRDGETVYFCCDGCKSKYEAQHGHARLAD